MVELGAFPSTALWRDQMEVTLLPEEMGWKLHPCLG